MDIDEFLDKEIPDKKKEVVEDKLASREVAKEGDDIGKYFELWEKVFDAKFAWDSNLYDEVSKAGTKIKEKSNELLKTIETEKSAIKQLILNANKEIDSINYEEATRIYSEISELHNKFPDFLFEEKKGT